MSEPQLDVVRLKNAELEASCALYLDLFEHAPVGYCVVAPGGSIQQANQTAAGLLGMARDSLLQLRFGALVCDEHQTRFERFCADLRRQPGSQSLELELIDGVGKRVAVLVRASSADTASPLRLTLQPGSLVQPIRHAPTDEERQLRTLLSNCPSVMYTCEIDGDFAATFVSENVEELLGYRAAEFVEDPQFWAARLHPEDAERVLNLLRSGLEQQHAQEYRFRHRDGSYRWLHDQVRVLSTGAGRPMMIGSLLDITARKVMEESLRESELRWQFAIHGSGDGLWDWDIARGVVFYSSQWKQMLGFEDREIGDGLKEWSERVHPEDTMRVMHELQDHLQARTPVYLCEHRIRRKDGSWIWTLDRGVVVSRDAAGRPVRMIGTHSDISQRRQIELALRESEQRFRVIFEGSPECIKVVDEKGCLLQMNPAGLAILEAESLDEVRSQGLLAFILPSYQAAFAALFASAMAGNAGVLEFEVAGLRGTRRWLQTHASPLPDAEGRISMMLGLTRDITQTYRAQEALANSNEMLRRASEMAKIGGWTLDLATMQLFWSLETCRIHELESPEAPTLEQAIAFYTPAARPCIQAAVHAGMQYGTPWDLELPMTSAKGRALWVRAQGSVLMEAGKPVKLVGALQDITARRQAEAALRVTDVALKSVSQGVIISDAERCIRSVNPAFVAITGFPEAEVLGRTCKFLQGPLSDQNTIEAIRERLREAKEFSGELINYRKDGAPFWNELTISPVLDSGGQVSHFIGITRDVTHRRQAEQVLRENELQMRLALRGGDLGVWDWDAASGRMLVNERWLAMLGLDPQGPAPTIELWHSLVHPDDLVKLHSLIDEVILNPAGRQIDVEIRARHQHGHWIWIHDMGSVVGRAADGSPLRIVGTHMDITVRKQAEEALRLSLQEKVALLNEVHHRVKNNLQVVTSLLRLESARCDQPETRAVLNDMKGRIRSMALLHESLYRSESFAAVDLASYLKQLATQAFRSLASQQGLVQLHLRLASVQVGMDQATPCGLLVNELLANCFKHAFPDGRKGQVHIELQPTGNGTEMTLKVCDDGVGLPEDFAVRRNLSLGLQLVGDLARQLGGKLEVGPPPGASFSLVFTPDDHPAPANPSTA